MWHGVKGLGKVQVYGIPLVMWARVRKDGCCKVDRSLKTKLESVELGSSSLL